MGRSNAVRAIIGIFGPRRPAGLPAEEVATALYRGILNREPDAAGLADQIRRMRSGAGLDQVVRDIVASPEFYARFLKELVPAAPLPDLTRLMPDGYQIQLVNGEPWLVYVARSDADIARMVAAVEKHRYYDRFGAWYPVIDLDKEVTAAIVRGLGARSCFELGCFTGPVLSLLAEAGIEVRGSEVSHTAFAFAYPNIRDAMMFGDLMTLDLDRRFAVVLCMDVLEHLNPLRLDAYLDKLATLVEDDGFLYVNSPMWGADAIFGLVEERYLEEWRAVGDAAFWRHWPCDRQGWPLHGHLVWAGPGWWEGRFAAHGLARDTVIERAIHARLGTFFATAIGRRSLFVLRGAANRKSSAAVAADVDAALAAVPGLQPREPA